VINPSFENSEGLVKGSPKFGELIEGSGLYAVRIKAANDQAISFGSSKSIGEHFVRDAVESIIEILVAATTSCELDEHR
jgi:hypothetical protein